MGHLDRIQVKTAAMEIDGDLKMGTSGGSIGPFWSRAHRGMQPFRHGTGEKEVTPFGTCRASNWAASIIAGRRRWVAP